jgi:hypothetical protein
MIGASRGHSWKFNTVIEFTGQLDPSSVPRGELPGDEGIIDHGDGRCAVPANSPRLRPYGVLVNENPSCNSPAASG